MNKNKLRKWLKSNSNIRNIARISRTRYFGDLGWSKIANNIDTLINHEAKHPNILIATSFGGEIAMTAVESLLAGALKVRGANVHILLCDGIQACQLCDTTRFSGTSKFVDTGLPKYVCRSCHLAGKRVYGSLNITTHKISSYLDTDDHKYAETLSKTVNYDQIRQLGIDKVPVGEHAVAGTCRYFAKANFSDEPLKDKVLRKYLHSAILVMRATQALLKKIDFSCTVLNHGIYIPQGVISEVSRSKGIRVVTWNYSIPQTIVLSLVIMIHIIMN